MDEDQIDKIERAEGSLKENPFAFLFSNLEEAEKYVRQQNDLVERILLVTNDYETHGSDRLTKLPPVCVFLENACDCQISQAVEQVLTERLKIENPATFLVDRYDVPRFCSADEREASESNLLKYIFSSYARLLHEEQQLLADTLVTLQVCRQVILQKLADLLGETKFRDKLFEELTVSSVANPTCRIVHDTASYLAELTSHRLRDVFVPLLEKLALEIKDDSFLDSGIFVHLNILSVFICHPDLAKLSLEYRTSDRQSRSLTILQILLEKSCQSVDDQDTPFFVNIHEMSGSEIKSDIQAIYNKLNRFHEKLAGIFQQLLKNNSTKVKLLSWIGDLLFQYAEMTRRWMHEVSNIYSGIFTSDALFINLSSVLLRLCQSFCSKTSLDFEEDPTKMKFLKINPTYIKATAITNATERDNKCVHGKNFHTDTCLLPSEQTFALSDSYDLITEMFFFTHKALQLGTYGMLIKFKRLSRELSALENRAGNIHETWNNLSADERERYDKGLKIYLGTKATMSEPTFMENCLSFMATSAQYLIQTGMTEDRSGIVRVSLPISVDQPIPNGLFCSPEYILDVMTDIISFANNFCKESIHCLDGFNHDFLLMATIYIGCKKRISNPHLRASLAKLCQYFLPLSENVLQRDTLFASGDELFDTFQYGPLLGISLMQIFVDVEYTGAHAEAEEKFTYRVPIYRILNYLWTKENCKKEILLCAEESLRNIEDQSKPLFLNFIEYVINDLNYSMDDVLEFLKKIKVLEREKDSGDWDELSATDRNMNEKKIIQFRGLVSYRNRMANFGIEFLVKIVREAEVKNFFWHPTMRDRIAEMFNNFLLKMVGPEMGALRVRDIHSLDFQPKDLLCNISRIYISLCEDDEFCRRVASDGRSYRDDLFQRACQVLRRFDEDLRQEMHLVAEHVAIMSDFAQEDEELYKDAPEEFFDSLIATFMQDPVILPSSLQVVDRSTIARHLMSDHTDPYNRAPLTMREVIPHTELKERIEAWLVEKRLQRNNVS